MRPRLLDLFCGAGGAAVGYHRAGFDVVGVDIKPQPNYPFRMIVADALDWLHDVLMCQRTGLQDAQGFPTRYAAIHASPPCQDYSNAVRHLSRPHERLIEPTRELLKATGLPWVIENVLGSPLPHQSTLDGSHGIELCGTMFGRRFQRHRRFETSFPLTHHRGCSHVRPPLNPYNSKSRIRDGLQKGAMRAFGNEMGVEWMGTDAEIGESIPPAYTEFIGAQLLAHIQAGAYR